VRLVGVEASGHGLDTAKHAATLTKGSPGVLHGSYSYLLQDAEGQVIDPHSISAGCVATTRFRSLHDASCVTCLASHHRQAAGCCAEVTAPNTDGRYFT
jgi:hypothetical protein